MVATHRSQGLETTRMGFQACSSRPTAWACRSPVAARGRSPSALDQDERGLALAWRTISSGHVSSSPRAWAAARCSSGPTSLGLLSRRAAFSGEHHMTLSTSLPSGSSAAPSTSTAQ